MFCNECGFENRNDRKFCQECGAKLKDYTKPPENLIMPEQVEFEKQQIKSKNKTALICNVIFGILLVAAITLTITPFFLEKNVKLVLFICALVCYASCLVVLIIKKALLKKFNKAND